MFPTLRNPPPFRTRLWAFTGFAALGVLLPACSKDDKANPPAVSASASARPTPVIPANASPTERIIIQARAALGPEDKLVAITTLELTGTVMDAKNQPVGQVAIMFKKPTRMRSEVQTPNGRMIQGSDGVTGWEFDIDKNNNKRNAVMQAKDEMQTINETLENLYFYRGTEHVTGAAVTDDGEVQYRGAACWKVSFHYPNDTIYVRYINRATGKLVSTVLEPMGVEFLEEGESQVNGISFPKVLHQYGKDGILAQTINFDKIIVNQPLDDRLFDQPSLIASFASPTTSAGSTPAAKPASSPSPSSSAAPGSTSAPLAMPTLPPLPKAN